MNVRSRLVSTADTVILRHCGHSKSPGPTQWGLTFPGGQTGSSFSANSRSIANACTTDSLRTLVLPISPYLRSQAITLPLRDAAQK